MTTARPTSNGGNASQTLEKRIISVGQRLSDSLEIVLEAVPGGPHRPQMLAKTLGVDKVLTSRLLKAARHRDPLAVVHLVPGSEPMRRVLRAARRQGASQEIIDTAMAAVDDFDQLVQSEVGDRSALETIISAWLPEAREQLETRRKQAAYRAMSELKGARTNATLGTVILNPADDGANIDVVWIMGMYGVSRLRPHAPVKFTTRRLAATEAPRRPATLEGVPIDGMPNGVRLDNFCSAAPAELDINRVGEATHYTLAGDDFGPRTDVDLVITEVNLAEMPRYVPSELERKGYVFAEIALPTKVLVFDVFVHEDVYPSREPSLVIYDTVLEGVADVNDRSRDADRLDLRESITPLGRGTSLRIRISEIPNYPEMMQYVFERMAWNAESFRCYRCRIDYPIYGSQVAMTFDPPPPPA